MKNLDALTVEWVALGGSYSNSGPETTARYRLIRLPVSEVPTVFRVERTTTETPE